jgi:hypothetical protein
MILVRTAGVFLRTTVFVSEASDSWWTNQKLVPSSLSLFITRHVCCLMYLDVLSCCGAHHKGALGA